MSVQIKRNKYGKMRVICDHLNVHIHTNKRYKERVVFLDLICAGVCINIACIGSFHHSSLTFIFLLTIYDIDST